MTIIEILHFIIDNKYVYKTLVITFLIVWFAYFTCVMDNVSNKPVKDIIKVLYGTLYDVISWLLIITFVLILILLLFS